MVRLSRHFFVSLMKATVFSLIIFFCFLPLFLSKSKVFILKGSLQTDKPVNMAVHTLEDSVYSGYFFQKITQSGPFYLTLNANKLQQIKISLETETPADIKIDETVIIGAKEFPLNFDTATIINSDSQEVSQDGRHVSLSTSKNNVTIELQKFSPQKAKRIYHLTWLNLFYLFPLLWCFLPLKLQKEIGKWSVFLFPLILLMLVKYFAFQHPYTLFFHKLTFNNLFQLEKYEFPIFAVIYGTLAIILFLKNKWLQRFFIAFLFVFLGILIIDGVVLHNLNSRFIFSEINNYKSEYSTAFYMFLSYCGTIQGRLMILCCVVLGYLVIHRSYFTALFYKLVSLALSVILLGIVFFYKTDFFLGYQFYNVFQANQSQNQTTPYTKEFISNLNQKFALSQNCITGLNKRKNVIVIIAESLSSFASYNLSGLHNYMPKLDKLMGDYAAYSSYYSNAYHTASGIFSLLTGVPAVHGYQKGLGNLETPIFFKDTLPLKLKKAGYQSSFWTAIEFNAQLQKIVEMSRFDKISDYQDPYYKDKPKLIFNAPSDHYLFENVLEQISRASKTSPYLMVISTISGHGPYIHPETKEQSFEKTMAYVDNEIDNFISSLKKLGFFENGMVLITGATI